MNEIKAREGFYLTQVDEVEDRVFLTAIKGANINEDDWREATKEEKSEWEKTLEEKLKQEELNRINM
jgi:hypothetical protein